jgi:hypothetical protein
VVGDDLSIILIGEAVLISGDSPVPATAWRLGLLDEQAEPHSKVEPAGPPQAYRLPRSEHQIDRFTVPSISSWRFENPRGHA